MPFSRNFLILIAVAILLSPFSPADAPAVTSSTHPQGQYSGNPFILMGVTYAGATNFIYSVDKVADTVPVEASATSVPAGKAINLGTKIDGIYYFHVRAKAASGLSDAAHYEIRVDNTPPLRPDSPRGIALEDGTGLIEWNAPQDLSGIASYNIYRSPVKLIKDGDIFREFTLRDSVVKKIAAGVKDTNYHDSGIVIGKAKVYFYKIQAVDNAGNQSNSSVAATVRTIGLCGINPAITASAKDSNLSVSLSAAGKIYHGTLTIYTPGNEPVVLDPNVSNRASAAGSYLLLGKTNGDYNIFFRGEDTDGFGCFAQKTFTYDTVAPEVKILSPPASKILADSVHFEAKAMDSGVNLSGIASVKFYFMLAAGETLLGEAQKSGEKYVLDWNSTASQNGRFTIAARATDNGGNNAEDSLVYSIQNNYLAKDSAAKAIKSAEDKRAQAIGHVMSLALNNLAVPDSNASISAGDQNLAYSKSLLAKEQFLDISEKSARDAEAIYAAVIAKVSLEPYGSGTYSYDSNQLGLFLKSSRISPSQVPEAESLVLKFSPSRRLDVLKVTRDGNSFYLASIAISMTSPDKNSARLNVVELIPKEFANDASRIVSGTRFDVLQKDPAIVFGDVFVDGNSGATVSIVYSLKQELTKAQADALLSSKVLDLFVSPPVLLLSTSKVSYVPQVNMPKINLPKVNLGGKTLIIIGVVGIVLIMLFALAVAIAAWFFFFRKKGSH